MKLNLGCGNHPIVGTIGVDWKQCGCADILWDLESVPWPFANERCEEVWMHDVVEHLGHRVFYPVMEEVWRILKPNHLCHIHTSIWNTEQSFREPTHVRFMTVESFNFFDRRWEYFERYKHNTTARFKVLEAVPDGLDLRVVLQKEGAVRGSLQQQIDELTAKMEGK